MCGIAGVYEYRNRHAVVPDVLDRMLDVIAHRGPDDSGTHFDRGLAFGSRRLSIIDLAGGHQPMTNEDGSVVVVSNGEIYNYRELTDRLRARGHTVATRSDTETIVHLYEDRGDDLVDELRGMFGLAVWDAPRERLLLARDRLGIKPLYYADTGDRLVFGSEIKAILQHPAIDARPDLTSLAHFLSLKYVPSPETMFAGIVALPPGHLLICGQDGVRVRPYWDLSFAREPGDPVPTEQEAFERLEELLRDAVRSHLVSDVPYGAFLSGGVDSSTVVALMTEILDHPVRTFSVGFEGDGARFSELPYARLVAQRYETEHHEVMIGPDDFVNLLEKVIWHLDQPIGDEACLPNYMLSELASRHVKMILSGEGGDELFAGYARYSFERLAPLFQALPGPARSLALSFAKIVPGQRRAKIALNALCQPSEVQRLASWFPLFNTEMTAELLSGVFRESPNGSSAADVFARQLAGSDAHDAVSRMLYVDTKLWLPDDLLARGDKTSMAASLEARVPLLDHPLVEFAASLPTGMKLRGRTRKYLLRKVAAQWLPEDVITRKKQGFPTPTSMWFRKETRTFLHEHISPETIARRGLFEPAYVQRLLSEHDRGAADHGSLLYGLLSVELWYQQYIDRSPRLSASAAAAGAR